MCGPGTTATGEGENLFTYEIRVVKIFSLRGEREGRNGGVSHVHMFRTWGNCPEKMPFSAAKP
jgi:hypothetical protein